MLIRFTYQGSVGLILCVNSTMEGFIETEENVNIPRSTEMGEVTLAYL